MGTCRCWSSFGLCTSAFRMHLHWLHAVFWPVLGYIVTSTYGRIHQIGLQAFPLELFEEGWTVLTLGLCHGAMTPPWRRKRRRLEAFGGLSLAQSTLARASSGPGLRYQRVDGSRVSARWAGGGSGSTECHLKIATWVRRWDWGGCQEGPVIPNLRYLEV